MRPPLLSDVLVVTFGGGGSIAQITDASRVCDLIRGLCSVMTPERLALAEFSVTPKTTLREA